MKSLSTTFLFTVALSLLVVSCSKTKEVLNDAKIKSATVVGAAVEKELKEAYAGISIENVDCNEEAVKLGDVAEAKVKDLLGVQTQSLNKSLAGSIVPTVCKLVVDEILIPQLNKVDTEYVCLKAAGSEKIGKVGTDLCASIDI